MIYFSDSVQLAIFTLSFEPSTSSILVAFKIVLGWSLDKILKDWNLISPLFITVETELVKVTS